MTRQYIGARYVPKFFSDEHGDPTWRDTIPYEALTIVTYLGNSYTSKKPVPIGKQITDTEYWVLTGNYVGQIEQYRQETAEVAETIASNQIFRSKYAIFIGDSYTGAASLGEHIGERYSTQVCSRLGLIEKNYAVGGCGYITGTDNYSVQLERALTELSSDEDRKAVKYVFVMGSRNDHEAQHSALFTACRDLYRSINTNFPNAKLVVAPMLWDYHYLMDEAVKNIEIINNALVYAKNLIYIENSYTWFIGRLSEVLYQNGANVHWTVFGHYRAADLVINAINGGEAYKPLGLLNLTPNITNIKTISSQFRTKVIGDKIFAKGQFTVSTSDVTSGTTLFTITLNGEDINDCYLGEQNVTPYIKNIVNSDVVPQLHLVSSCTKTGDASSDYSYTINVISDGALSYGNTVSFTCEIPFAIPQI